MFHREQIALLEDLNEVAAETCVRIHLVGGIVRDLFLGVPLHDRDIDIVVEGDAGAFLDRAARRIEAELKQFPAFLTSKLEAPKRYPAVAEVDVASPRRETYEKPGALPTVAPSVLNDDLRRRDFSMNAVALPVSALIEHRAGGGTDLAALAAKALDPFGGLADLRGRSLRVLHSRSFIDDPTRMYRGCRYAGRVPAAFDARTEELLREAVRDHASRTISGFRLFREIRYAFEEDCGPKIAAVLASHGLLRGPIFEDEGAESKFTAAAAKLPSAEGQEKRLIALLFHFSRGGDAAGAERLFKSFGLSKKDISSIAALARDAAGGKGDPQLADAIRAGEAR